MSGAARRIPYHSVLEDLVVCRPVWGRRTVVQDPDRAELLDVVNECEVCGQLRHRCTCGGVS